MESSEVFRRGLVQQGYVVQSAEELRELTWALRFTPGLCMIGAVIGLVMQLPWMHFTLAVLGVSALLLPAHQPFDLLYNHVVRPLVDGPRLPPNPLQRRIACFLGGLMNLAIGFAFVAQAMVVAYAVGLLLIVLQIIVIGAHFCVASWMWELGASLLGHRSDRLSSSESHRLVDQGAMLIDVRTPREYARQHLPGAVNVPLGQINEQVDVLRNHAAPLVLYCQTGARSRRATSKLRALGLEQVHDLGAIRRW